MSWAGLEEDAAVGGGGGEEGRGLQGQAGQAGVRVDEDAKEIDEKIEKEIKEKIDKEIKNQKTQKIKLIFSAKNQDNLYPFTYLNTLPRCLQR